MTVMQVTGPKKNKEKRIGTVEFDLRDCVLASAASRCAPALPRPAPDYECFRGSFGARMAHYTGNVSALRPAALQIPARLSGTHRRTRVFFGDSSQSAGLFLELIAERGSFSGRAWSSGSWRARPCCAGSASPSGAAPAYTAAVPVDIPCCSCNPVGYSLPQLQSLWRFPTAAVISVKHVSGGQHHRDVDPQLQPL